MAEWADVGRAQRKARSVATAIVGLCGRTRIVSNRCPRLRSNCLRVARPRLYLATLVFAMPSSLLHIAAPLKHLPIRHKSLSELALPDTSFTLRCLLLPRLHAPLSSVSLTARPRLSSISRRNSRSQRLFAPTHPAHSAPPSMNRPQTPLTPSLVSRTHPARVAP